MPVTAYQPIDFNGYAGPNIAPNLTNGLNPEALNIQTETGGAILALPGFRRVFPYPLDDRGSNYQQQAKVVGQKAVVLFDGSTAFDRACLGIAVVDWQTTAYPRVLALGYNTQLQPGMFITDVDTGPQSVDPSLLDFSSSNYRHLYIHDASIGKDNWNQSGQSASTGSPPYGRIPVIGKLSAHEYPNIISYGSKTHIIDPWGLGITIDGSNSPRESGLRPPTRPPMLFTQPASYLGLPDMSWKDEGNNTGNPWTAHSDITASQLAITYSDTATPATGAYPVPFLNTGAGKNAAQLGQGNTEAEDWVEMKMYPTGEGPSAAPGSRIAYRDVTFDTQGASTGAATRIWVSLMVRDNDRKPVQVERNFFAIQLCTQPGLAGTVYELPIDIPMQGGHWYLHDLPWEDADGNAIGDVEIQSIGIKYKGDISAPIIDNFDFFEDTGDITQSLGNFTIGFGGLACVVGMPGPFLGVNRFRYCFSDPETGIDSDLSPPSDELNVGNTTGHSLCVIAEGYRGWWNKSGGSPVPDNENGLGSIPYDSTHNDEGVWAPNLKSFIHKQEYGVYTEGPQINQPIFREMSITGGVPIAGGDGTTSPSRGDHDWRISANAYEGTLLFIVAQDEVIPDNEEKVIAVSIDTDGGPDEISGMDIIDSRVPEAPFGTRSPRPSTELAVMHGERMVLAREPDFSAGQISVTQFYDQATLIPDSSEERFYPSLRGRQLRIYDANIRQDNTFAPDNLYDVVDVVDSTHIVIGRKFNGITNRYGETYRGPSRNTAGQYADYRIMGRKNRVYFSYRDALSVNHEYFPLWNYFDVAMGADEIVAIFPQGRALFIFGRTGVWIAYQNADISDDAPSGLVYPAPRPLAGAPGCAAKRTVVAMPDGNIIYLATGGRIGIVNSSGGQIHPLSSAVSGYIRNETSEIDPAFIEHAHSAYDPRKRHWWTWFIRDNASDDSCSEQGASYDASQGVVDPDYGPGFVLDTENNLVTRISDVLSVTGGGGTKTNVPLTCTVSVPGTCPSGNRPADRVFAGDAFGTIHEIFDDESFGFGAPTAACLRNTAASGDSTSVTVSGAPYPVTYDDPDNAGQYWDLRGLPVRVSRPSTGEESIQEISYNTNNSVVVSGWGSAFNDPATPTSGDIVEVAPIDCEIHQQEIHTRYESMFDAFTANTYGESSADPVVKVDLYTGDGNQFADGDTPKSTTELQKDEINTQRDIMLPHVPDRARRIGLRWTQPKEGRFEIRGAKVRSVVSGGEDGR